MTFLNILVKGGWLMIPIAICSVIAIIIVIDRLLTFRNASIPEDFAGRCKTLLQRGDRDGALELCRVYDSPVARVVKEGITADEDAMGVKANAEILSLERYFVGLATIAGIAPLLGFLGTVTGMIRAFMQVQRLGGNVNASVLAGGIWEALVTTATGLAVGIITYIFYNHLVGRVKSFSMLMQSMGHEIIKCK